LRGDFYRELAVMAGADPPSFSAKRKEPGTRGSDSNKQVRNARMLQTLALRPRYETYREGLAAILGVE